MKIALAIDRMDPTRGGRETSTAEVARALAALGCEVSIYCNTAAWESPEVEIVSIARRGLTRPGRLRNFIHDVRRVAHDRGEDILHATFPLPGADVYQMRSGTIRSQRRAALDRRGWLGRLLARAVYPLNLHRAYLAHLERRTLSESGPWLLPVSEMAARELHDHCPQRRRIRVVQNAVGLPAESEASRRRRREQLRAEQGVGDDEPVFLTIATNFELKGVAELIRALADWRRRHGGGRLWVLGRERPQRYARLAARLGVADAVQFFPATRDVFAWYAAADACVLLSWYDPCSRVVLEAMRMGLPTITTAYNGAADLLADGAGLVVSSPRDRAAVVEALDRAVDPLERSKMLAACHAAGSRIRVENHARALVDLYEGIVREKRARLRASALPQRTRPRLAAGGGLASRGSRAA